PSSARTTSDLVPRLLAPRLSPGRGTRRRGLNWRFPVHFKSILGLSLIFILTGRVRAEDYPSTAPAVPLTRDDAKKMLRSWKKVKPRLPLPPTTEDERKRSDGRPVVNNGRMQAYYLPTEVRGGGFSREPDPAMSLDNTFKTELFWLVSRVSNCRY